MKTTLKGLENEILEKDFENFDGFDADGFDADGFDADGFDADGYDMDGNYDEAYDESYDESYSGKSGKSVPLSEQTLDVTVVSTATTPTLVKLFAGNRNGNAANYGNPTTTTVTSNGSAAGYGQLLETVKSSPMVVRGITIFVNNATQLSNQIDFIEYLPGGSEMKQPFRPSSRRKSSNFNPNIIEAAGLTFDISGNHEISFIINAGEQVTFTLFVQSKVDVANLNKGRSAVERKRPAKRSRRRGR